MNLSSESNWLTVVYAGLLIGILALNLTHFVLKCVPYSITLIVIGVIIGVIPGLSGITNEVDDLDPHIFLMVFLPNLIFFSVFSINFYDLRKVAWPALLLAIPGVIINTVLTSFVVKYILPSFNWGWKYSLLFGAILSATDPVAVVALLRDLKAPQSIATIIEAESLFNDASSILLYTILVKTITESGTNSSLLSYVSRSAQMLIGPLIGFVVGLLLVYIVARLPQSCEVSQMTETSLTFVASNLVYLSSELLNSSGVLSSVFIGLVCSKFKSNFSPKNMRNLEQFWDIIEYFCNTLIFLISGTIVVRNATAVSFDMYKVLFLVAIYLWIHLTRFLTLLILHPLLRKLDNTYDIKVASVLWYGSLRGAIGLALSLMTKHVKNFDKKISENIIFYVCGIVFLTLLINGTTIRLVLKALKIKGFIYRSGDVIRSALDHMQNKSEHLVKVLAQNNHFSGANWQKIKAGLPDYSRILKTDDYELSQEKDKCLQNIRYRFICSMKSFYCKQHYDGMITNHAYNILIDAADEAIDKNDIEVQWKSIKKHFKLPRYAVLMNKVSGLKGITNKILYNRIFLSFQLSSSFVIASDRNKIIVDSFVEWKDSKDLALVEEELQTIEQNAILELNNIQKTYPEVYQAIQTRTALVFILNIDIHNVRKMQKEGIIHPSECHEMIEKLEATIHRSNIKRQFDSKYDPLAAFRNFPFVSSLEPDVITQLSSKVKYKVFSEDSYLYHKGETKECAYIIIRGLVEVQRDENLKAIWGTGSIVNLWSTISENASISTCFCQTPVTALKISKQVLQELMKHEKSEEILWRCAGFMLLRVMYVTEVGPGFDTIKLGEHVLASTLKNCNGMVEVESAFLLLKGSARSVRQNYEAPALVNIASEALEERVVGVVNRAQIEFTNAVALFLDGKGCPFGNGEMCLPDSPSKGNFMDRKLSIGMIYVKGSRQSKRTDGERDRMF